MANYIVTDTELTGIANVIRAVSGTTAPIQFPNDYISKIETLEVEENDVNFYDPLMNNGEGGRCYSYTREEFLALTELPPNPNHSNYKDHGISIPMTSQGWNWTLADAKEYIQKMSVLYIGQNYIPTDNKTHIVCYVPYDSPSTSWGINIPAGSGTYQIDDGEVTSFSNDIDTAFSSTGWHDVKISCSSFYRDDAPSDEVISKIQKIHSAYIAYQASGWPTYNQYAFAYCSNLKTLTLPVNNAWQASYTDDNLWDAGYTFSGYSFLKCCCLKAIVLPQGTNFYGSANIQDCHFLKYIIAGKNIEFAGFEAQCYNCYSLSYVPFINSHMVQDCFYNCLNLFKVNLGNTTICGNLFNKCINLREIRILKTNSIIGFENISSTDVFNSLPSDYKIIVPTGMRATYIANSEWAKIANHIIEAS